MTLCIELVLHQHIIPMIQQILHILRFPPQHCWKLTIQYLLLNILISWGNLTFQRVGVQLAHWAAVWRQKTREERRGEWQSLHWRSLQRVLPSDFYLLFRSHQWVTESFCGTNVSVMPFSFMENRIWWRFLRSNISNQYAHFWALNATGV